MKNTLKRIIVIFLMKGYNLLNITLLILCASCTNRDADFEGFLKYFAENYKEFAESLKQWAPLFIGAAACAAFMSIFGGLYIYRNGWRSLIPQSWRKTEN